MELEELLEYLSEGKTLTAGTEAFDCMHRWSLETQRLTQELNTAACRRKFSVSPPRKPEARGCAASSEAHWEKRQEAFFSSSVENSVHGRL